MSLISVSMSESAIFIQTYSFAYLCVLADCGVNLRKKVVRDTQTIFTLESKAVDSCQSLTNTRLVL